MSQSEQASRSTHHASRNTHHTAAKRHDLRVPVSGARCPVPVARRPLPVVRSIYCRSFRSGPSRTIRYAIRPANSRQVDLSCGTTNALLSVSEPEKCEYRFKVTSPALCYPVEEGGGAAGAAGVKAEL